MRAPLFLIPVALSSAGCSSPAEIERKTGVAAEASGVPPAAARAAAFTDSDERDGGMREFAYSWPAAVSAQPGLARQLAAERDAVLAQEKAEWTAALADSPADCTGCRGRAYTIAWTVVADTPGWLSLSGEVATYTGGAHGMSARRSLVWDKAARKAMDGAALFRSPEALDAALGPKLCAALNAERETRRGEPVPPPADGDFGFDSCQSAKDATVLVGSSTGQAFDRIGIWFGPYVAGSYAEGPYELDFPVDAAVLRAVKPEFAKAFGATR